MKLESVCVRAPHSTGESADMCAGYLHGLSNVP
jgi:hypothetical protein